MTTKPAPDARTITIPEIRLLRVAVTIEGMTPLITHRFGELAQGKIETKQQKGAKLAREARDPQAEFKDALYFTDDGRYGFPASGIKKALVHAGGRFADEKMTELRGILNVQGGILPIRSPEPTMRKDVIRLPSKAGDMRYRPQFWPWEIDVPVVFNAGMMSVDQLVNLFSIAGFSVGIGDWRPETNGIFGQFQIKGDVREESLR